MSDLVERRLREFTRAILHGDEAHKAWLREAVECFIAGQPLPAPAGLGQVRYARATDLIGRAMKHGVNGADMYDADAATNLGRQMRAFLSSSDHEAQLYLDVVKTAGFAWEHGCAPSKDLINQGDVRFISVNEADFLLFQFAVSALDQALKPTPTERGD